MYLFVSVAAAASSPGAQLSNTAFYSIYQQSQPESTSQTGYSNIFHYIVTVVAMGWVGGILITKPSSVLLVNQIVHSSTVRFYV